MGAKPMLFAVILNSHKHRRSFYTSLLLVFVLCQIQTTAVLAQLIPRSYNNVSLDQYKQPFFSKDGRVYPLKQENARFVLSNFLDAVTGTKKGLRFDFRNPGLSGSLVYGFVPFGDSQHPQPVYFNRTAVLSGGIAEIDLNVMRGKYDMVNWEENGNGTIGYRVIGTDGLIIYDGITGFSGKDPFSIDPVITEGPFVSDIQPYGVSIWYVTNKECRSSLAIDGRVNDENSPVIYHRFDIIGLDPGTTYQYAVTLGERTYEFSFSTAPDPGSRKRFVFAYASDSRTGIGGGERSMFGVNAYVLKKIMALASYRKAAFVQFTGDLIDGYLSSKDEMNLQYANWKRAVQPYWHHLPVYTGMGNHESLLHQFVDDQNNTKYSIDKFPYEIHSAEEAFAGNFLHPENGPKSEDGTSYDPDPRTVDFPSYRENVYYYTYDNVAVVVLNSNYWYAPGLWRSKNGPGGNPHGYIMDKQLAWLESTLSRLDADGTIDHIFVTFHTPMFPNGGHVSDDMWYNGNNGPRPVIAGNPVKKGIIEQRDALLNILANKSSKVVAILTGDEHNYNRLLIDESMERYPEGWALERSEPGRGIWQINNGAAGAPYYAQEPTPWSDRVKGFTTQNALVFIHINGGSVELEVRNPDTLELIDEAKLR
jgi:calcineurin-like phosphoesterase family protein